MKLLFVTTAVMVVFASPADADPAANRHAKHTDRIAAHNENEEGALNHAERRAARQMRRANRIAKYDTNGDGALDAEERSALRAARKAKRAARRAAVLAEFDTNQDGRLDEQERNARRAQRLAKRFSAFDTNSDSVITLEEFTAGANMRHRGHKRKMKRRLRKQGKLRTRGQAH